MNCIKCPQKAVIQLQHGPLCKNHFLSYFEDKVINTIQKYRLIDRNDKVVVACSGGKDSLTILYLAKKYFHKKNYPKENLQALCIDEGIKNYRSKTIIDLKKFCKKENVPLTIISAKEEFGCTLDQALKKNKQKEKYRPCHICGVWRRYLLNKYARKLGANKVLTGHNLDDEAQVIAMNFFKANTTLSSHLGPISGLEEHRLFVPRVKPLYFCPEKETKLYSILKKFPVRFCECPYAEEGYRAHIRNMLNDLEQQYPGTKQGIIRSFLETLPLLKEHALKNPQQKIQECQKCHEPANQNICNACKITEELNNKEKQK